MRRPWFRDHKTALLVGLALFAAGVLALYDAYDRRGMRAPWPLSAILPF